MSLTALVGLMFMATGVAVAIIGRRRRRGFDIGVVFVSAAAVYHAATEVVQLMAPGRNDYRTLVSQRLIDDWIFLSGVGLFAFAVSYSLASRQLSLRRRSDERQGRRVLSARLLVVLALPFYAYSVGGRLFGFSEATTAGLGHSVTVLTMSLAAVSVAARVRPTRRVWVLVALGGSVSVFGGRLLVFSAVVTTWCLLRTSAVEIRLADEQRTARRRAVLLLAIVTIATIAISGARSVAGRQEFAARDLRGRATLLVDGLRGAATPEVRDAIADDVVYRFDGNAWPAQVLDRLRSGGEPVGLETVEAAIARAVPSAIYRSKLTNETTSITEEEYINRELSIEAENVDWLPTHMGVLLAMTGTFLFVPALVLFALVIAWLDHWLTRRSSDARYVLGAGVLLATVSYERGIEAFALETRAALLLAGAIYVLRALEPRRPLSPVATA